MSDKNITQLKDASDSAMTWTPADALADCLEEAKEEGSFLNGCNKMLVIGLNDKGRGYRFSMRNSRLNNAEVVALIETVKSLCVSELNGGEN